MKKILFFLLISFVAISCQQSQDNKADNDHMSMNKDSIASCCAVKDGLFLHISSGYENPHKVLMALKMANMMSMEQPVLLYFDINGVELLLKTSKEMKYKDFPTLTELLDQLVEKRVTIMACPTCLKIAGFQPEDLRNGVIIAQKDKFFNFTKGRIITLDY